MKLIYYFSWNINKKIEKSLWIHEVYESMKSILSSGKSDTTKRNGSNISQNEAQKNVSRLQFLYACCQLFDCLNGWPIKFSKQLFQLFLIFKEI